MPNGVVTRAREVQETLEELNVTLSEHERPGARESEPSSPMQLSLFEPKVSAVAKELSAIDSDDLSPKQAWDLIDKLSKKARRELS